MYAVLAAVNNGQYSASCGTSDGFILAYNENDFSIGTSVYLCKGITVTVGNGSYNINFYALS